MADPDCLKCPGIPKDQGILWPTRWFPCNTGFHLRKDGTFPQEDFEAYVREYGMLWREGCPYLDQPAVPAVPVAKPKQPKGFRRVGGSRYGFTLIELLIVLAIVGIAAACIIPALHDHYQKKDNPPAPLTALQPVTRISNWDGEVREKLREVCVSGHVHYFADIDSGFGDANTRAIIFAPKLDDDGKPVKCGPELEKEK